ncbi:MAG: hypothetical protein MRZ66_05890 [Clostridiales bacterium]|nr:hypothetical protein [Clostridiales bacterium]
MKKIKKELKNWIVYVLQAAGPSSYDGAYIEHLHILPEMIRLYQELCNKDCRKAVENFDTIHIASQSDKEQFLKYVAGEIRKTFE